jgi:hypothetical protein
LAGGVATLGFAKTDNRFLMGGPGTSLALELLSRREPDLPRNIIAITPWILAQPKESNHSTIHHPDLHILPW